MVVDRLEEAARLIESGVDVVLMLDPGSVPPPRCGPGRLAVLVGDPADPALRAAAAEMDTELFGPPVTSAPGPVPA